jgi:zinc resistance-associated protein
MFRTVFAGAAALMIAAGAVAYAQQPPGPDGGRRLFAPEDRAALLDARVAALHAGLRLTPEQDKAWPAFEQAYRDLAALRGRRPSGPGADESLDPVQRAHRMAEALTTRGAAIKHYADAMGPLYQSLDESQKRRFGFLSRMGRPHFHHFAFWRDGERGDLRRPREEFGEFGRREFGRGDFSPPR